MLSIKESEISTKCKLKVKLKTSEKLYNFFQAGLITKCNFFNKKTFSK